MSEHASWSDDVGAYLLGALGPDEATAFEAHLDGCELCRRDVEQLRPAADALPIGVPLVAPPPALKERIMAVVEREAQLLAAAGEGADRPEPAAAPARERRSWLGWLSRPAVALACAVVLLALGTGAGLLLGGGEEAHTVVAQAPQGADVRLEMTGDDAVLVARGMPAPPSGRLYQVWLKRKGRAPEPMPVLWSVDSRGRADVAIPGPLDGVEAVLVTDEPPRGSRAPTREPVISATPA